jgi:DNA-binding transcriptional LysR family regulator
MTVAGHRFLGDIRQVLAYFEAALRAVRSAGQAGEGHLKIGVVASATSGIFNRIMRSYCAQHPGVVVEFYEDSPRTHIGRLNGRVLDVAVLPGNPQLQGCDIAQLWEEPILAALPRTDPRASLSHLHLKDLEMDKFIVSRGPPGPEIHDFIVKRLGTIGLSLQVGHHAVGREGLMALIALGFGISLISGAEADVTYPNVAFVPLAGETLPFNVAWSAENDNPALRRFISLARASTRQNVFAAEPREQ